MSQAVTPLRIQTTTKAIATGIFSDQWQMIESLPIEMGFAPWTRERGTLRTLSPTARTAVLNAARSEVQQDVRAQCCLDSMYFSGKGLAKFAMMAYAVHDLVGDQTLARQILDKLKAAFAVFVENKQQNPVI
jgi:endo-1,3(4)-beta-glucanase